LRRAADDAAAGDRNASPQGAPRGRFSALWRPIETGTYRAHERRFDIINIFDTVGQIRDGTGVGVGAPQFGPRRTFRAGLSQRF
jgi:hypothetical protein